MEPLGLSAYRVSTDLQVPPIAISEILRGKRAISAAMALRLGGYFGVDPQFWLSLQAAHDLQTTAGHNWRSNGTENGDKAVVPRCAALAGRSFVLREHSTAAGRGWEVLMTRPGAGGKNGRTHANQQSIPRAHYAKANRPVRPTKANT